MNILLRYKWLIVILMIAATLRFWQLGNIPPSLDWDEAALGYNAYSILKTGRDEYGTFLPRTLRSFDDYKPPLYVYEAIPSIAAFGLTPWAVRLPSAIMGVLAVLGTFFLVKELFRNKIFLTDNQQPITNNRFALLTAMLLAISPWHIQFSRIAFEANSGITINIFALYAFFRGLRSSKWLVFSGMLFGLGFYAYHSERVFLPLMALVLAFLYRKELWKLKKYVLLAMLAGFLVVLPLMPVLFDKSTLVRLQGTSALADKTGLLMRSTKKIQDDIASGNHFGIIFDNRRLVYVRKLLDGYLSHFSIRWLFLTGDNERHHAPDMGLLYLWELPFVLYGFFLVMKQGDRTAKLLFAWFFIAPIAASPTSELPHAIRTLVFLPTFQIFTAYGLLSFLSYITDHVSQKKNRLSIYLFSVCCLFFIFFNIVYYLDMYFLHLNREYSEFWQYGYKQAVEYARVNGSKYKKIVVSTKLEQPHMFFLFYLKYDPEAYLREGGTASGGFKEVRNKFGIYEFRPIVPEKEIFDGKTLFIAHPTETKKANLLDIRYLDGSDAIHILDR